MTEPDESGWSAGTDLTVPPPWLRLLAYAVVAAAVVASAAARY